MTKNPTTLSFTILSLILVSCLSLFGQKFGDVKLNDFNVELNEVDALADAVYLIKKEEVEYGYKDDNLVIFYKVHERIKILTRAGEAYANFSFGLWDEPNFKENLVGIKGISYNVVDEKIEKTKLSKDEIISEKISKNYQSIEFVMPNVKIGTIIELKYKFIVPFSHSLDRFFFQTEIPVEYAEYTVNIPDEIVLTPIASGSVQLESKQANYISNEFIGQKYTFSTRDVSSLRSDDYVMNINDYRSSLKFEISQTQWKKDKVRQYSSSWNQVAKELNKHDNFGLELERELKSLDLQILNAKKQEGKEQIKFLYDYIRENYTWNEAYGIYTESLTKAVEDKSGNVSELNLLLCNLLKKAGHEVRPALIKTRERGLQNDLFPSLSEFNYVIVEVIFENEVILLDATEKFLTMGNIPTRAVSNNYFVIESNQGNIKTLNNPNNYLKAVALSYEVDMTEEALIGNGKEKYSNYGAVLERELMIEEGQQFEETLGQDESRGNTTGFEKIENKDDIYNPLTYVIEKNLYKEIKFIEDKILIEACLDSPYGENPFTEDQRAFPIFYTNKINISWSYQIRVPEGYTVETIPETIFISLGKSNDKYLYDCKVFNDIIQITSKIKVNNEIIPAEQYEAAKQFYEVIERKHQEKIILVRSN